jgi:hypothetical protein
MMMLMRLSGHCCYGVVLLAPPSLRVLAGKVHTLAPPARGQLGPVGHIEKHLEQTNGDTPTCSTQLQQCQSRPTYLTIHVITQLQNL